MTAGDVVLLNFPFSDLSGAKLRPAVVVAVVDQGDFIACQVTSRHAADAVALRASDFVQGGLQRDSYARPGKLFTANRSIVAKRVGQVQETTRDSIRDAVIRIIRDA
jgi:mRNA interferase MazF